MEGIGSLLRQWLRAYRGVRKMYLYLYVNAFESFHNMKRKASNTNGTYRMMRRGKKTPVDTRLHDW
jgi:transposase-like protein